MAGFDIGYRLDFLDFMYRFSSKFFQSTDKIFYSLTTSEVTIRFEIK